MPVKDYVIDLSNELGFSQTGEVVRAERKLVTESLHKRVQKPSTAQPISPTRVTKMPEQAAWSAASTDTQPPLLPPLLQ
ncbi:hypothetical protein M422DRAFT_239330 [Sphaerobolus stellatus SS14]|nr:hypothetical protein M422DRAFT_239330 [Sphaerobolus stellatus SS14]